MPAISKAWVTVPDTAVDPDSPLDTTLVTALRDDLVHLREWLGAAYYAGAVQDHNHDGVNSALVEIGPNLLRNGSFEQDTNGWSITTYTGGSQTINTANHIDGAKALAFTSTSTANGGGQATNGQFINVTGGEGVELYMALKASVANVSSKVELIWYDNAQAQISITDLYVSTNTPTVNTPLYLGDAAPANARFCKVRLTGAVPGSGSATGTVYFDGLRMGKAHPAVAGTQVLSPTYGGSSGNTSPTLVAQLVATLSGTYRTFMTLRNAGAASSVNGRIYKNGVAFGSSRNTGSATAQNYTEDLAFRKGDLIQIYAWSSTTAEPSEVSLRVGLSGSSGNYVS